MQPTSGSQQYPPSGYPDQREPGGRPGFAPAPPQAGIVRVRAWLVGIVAGVAMLVLIAAISNQGVADQIRKHSLNSSRFFDNVVQATTVYSWRFSPPLSTDVGHIWIAGLIFDVLVVLLTLFITTALSKHKRGFGGTFLAAWVAAFVATQVSSYVRASIVDLGQLQAQNAGKSIVIFFSQYSPGAYSAFAGLLYGLIAALVAGAVAAATRRTEILAAPAPAYAPSPQPDEPPQRREPQQAQAWAAPPPPGPISSSSPSPWTDSRVDTTERDGPQPTAVLPVVDGPRGEDTRTDDTRTDDTRRAGPADAQATTQFPAYPSHDEQAREQRREPQADRGPESESTQAYRVPIDGDEPDLDEPTQAHRLPRDDEEPPRRQ